MEKSQSWSIVIFCYNEEGSITKVVQSAYDLAEKNMPENYEILIVNDGSTDNTGSIIQELAQKYKTIRVITHPVNLGIGGALRTGYLNAKNENICSVPADGQFDVNELAPFINIPPKTFISFHREVKGYYSSYRTLLSWMNRMVNQIFLGVKVKDVNWVKVSKRDELKKIDLQMKSSLIETEICAKLLITSNTVKEVPSSYHPRIAGSVKGSSLKELKIIGREVYKLIRIVRKFKRSYTKNQAKI